MTDRSTQCDPAVSVVMTAYNAAPYVREAVESILNQTFRRFELVVVNDGSTDETATVLDSFDDPRLRIIHQPNAGRARAANRGIAAARTPIIARMDADDRSHPVRLERQFAVLAACSDVDLVTTRMRKTDAAGRPLDALSPAHLPRTVCWASIANQRRSFRLEGPVTEALLEAPFMPHASLMMRRRAGDAVGWYDAAFERAEDLHMYLRLARAGCRMAFIDDPLYDYRQLPGGEDGQRALDAYAWQVRCVEAVAADANTSRSLRTAARRSLGRLQRDQAYRLRRCGRFPEARNMYAAAARNCPCPENLIAWALTTCRLPDVPVMRLARAVHNRATGGAGVGLR